jgi:hypothetical protein
MISRSQRGTDRIRLPPPETKDKAVQPAAAKAFETNSARSYLVCTIFSPNVESLLVMLTSGRLFSILCRMNDRIIARAVLAFGCLGAYTLAMTPSMWF